MPAFDSFRSVRWFRTFNLVLQALLFLTLFGGLNYLALNHAWRYDLTSHHRYSLSPETLAYLRNLNLPVRVVVTLTEDSDHPEVVAALPEVRGLLREYAYATEANYDPKTGHDGRILVEELDVDRQLREASQLGIDQRDAVVFICGDKPRRVVALGELYRVVNGEARDFIGEQAFTSAILDVSSPEQKKIYFLSGHGESLIESDPMRGVSALADELRLRNYAVDTIELGTAGSKVPDDAALVIAVGPQKVDAYTQEQLRQYLGPRAGHLLLLLTPRVASGLTELLLDWGVLADDDVIYDSDPNEKTEQGDLLIKFFALDHPITRRLVEMNNLPLLVSQARSLHPLPVGGLKVRVLAATSPTAWGETDYYRQPVFSPGDIKGLPQIEPKNRLGVIIASEREQPRDNLPNSVASGRLAVFGSTDFATNKGFLGVPGNQNIILSAVDWAVGREQLNVPARPVERFKLSLSAGELIRLRYSLLFAVPGAAALLGLIVYWTRRR